MALFWGAKSSSVWYNKDDYRIITLTYLGHSCTTVRSMYQSQNWDSHQNQHHWYKIMITNEFIGGRSFEMSSIVPVLYILGYYFL